MNIYIPLYTYHYVKRREAKSKGEKEKYKHLNAEFQRIAKGDKKVFLSNQCKEIEENNRMGKTRDLFKKIVDIKGKFHAKLGMIKYRNSKDLTEEEISSLSHSIVFLGIVHLRKLSFISLLFSGTLHSDGYIFPLLPCLSLLLFTQLFIKPPQATTCPSCIISI